jgi:hypothetical protein
MEREKQYQQAHAVLRCVIGAVFLYGIGMVVAGRTVACTLFDALGFGPNSHSLDPKGERYAVFCFGVIGAVIVGWMLSLHCLLELCKVPTGMNPDIRRLSHRGIFISASCWFVLDTAFSMVIGEYSHALFNLPFGMLIMVPLYVMHQNC